MAVSLVLAQTGPFLHCRLSIHSLRGNVSVAAGILGSRESTEHLGQVPDILFVNFRLSSYFQYSNPALKSFACLPDPGLFVLASEGKPPASCQSREEPSVT